MASLKLNFLINSSAKELLPIPAAPQTIILKYDLFVEEWLSSCRLSYVTDYKSRFLSPTLTSSCDSDESSSSNALRSDALKFTLLFYCAIGDVWLLIIFFTGLQMLIGGSI